MNPSNHDDHLATQIKDAYGEVPVPNFDAWCQRHQDTVVSVTEAPTIAPVAAPLAAPLAAKRPRQRRAVRLRWIGAALLVVAGLVWLQSGPTLDREAFAEAIPGIDDARSVTWTQTAFGRVTSQDGQRTWLRRHRRLCAYRSPGQYRETDLNEAGEPEVVRITDVRSHRTLQLDLRSKKATLTTALTSPDPRGPFAPYGDALRRIDKSVKSVSLRGQKVFGGAKVNVVRVVHDAGTGYKPVYRDLMFDATSKRFAGLLASQGHADFDPDVAADRDHAAEKEWSQEAMWGTVENEIVFDAKFDKSTFSLDAPPGYAVEMIAKPTVTEEEAIAYLGVAARVNGDVFPDAPLEWFDPTKTQALEVKAPADRTAREQETLDLVHDLRMKFALRQIHLVPLRVFVDDHAAPGTFHYVGSEVKVGSSDRIVCWYQFRNATKYRVVFGDLSVKDVAKAELPLELPQ